MIRLLGLLSAFALALYSCGAVKPRSCSSEEPEFKVVLKLGARPLPPDTVVHVAYGGSGKEEFRLSDPSARLRVTFCCPADENGVPFADCALPGNSAAGAAGAASGSEDSPGVPALFCKLWTAGFTELEITGTGFMSVDYKLRPKEDTCIVERLLVLDAPDAGT
ncbi:MAG TPA: hypothetical protein VFK05_38935 [Polyangiaceae bacterium]|nr:hypothetical protein [Polyangiaceae bacterium]